MKQQLCTAYHERGAVGIEAAAAASTRVVIVYCFPSVSSRDGADGRPRSVYLSSIIVAAVRPASFFYFKEAPRDSSNFLFPFYMIIYYVIL